MTDSRRKGEAGEREAALILRDLLGPSVLRNLTQARDGGHDLIGIPGWTTEVKRLYASGARVVEADGGASKRGEARAHLPRRP